MRGIFIGLLAWCALYTEPSLAEQIRAWPVKQLASANADWVGLGISRHAIVKKMSTSHARRLYAIFSSLTAASQVHAEFFIVDGKMPNAFATLDVHEKSVVAINFAMLDLLGDDVHEMAAVLGHELAHLKLGHVRASAARDRAGSALNMLGELAMGALGVPGGGYLSGLTIDAVNASFSRDQERAADYLGTVWAVQAGYDPMAGANLHVRLMQISPGSGSFLSSHPSSPERISNLKALGARLGRNGE